MESTFYNTQDPEDFKNFPFTDVDSKAKSFSLQLF